MQFYLKAAVVVVAVVSLAAQCNAGRYATLDMDLNGFGNLADCNNFCEGHFGTCDRGTVVHNSFWNVDSCYCHDCEIDGSADLDGGISQSGIIAAGGTTCTSHCANNYGGCAYGVYGANWGGSICYCYDCDNSCYNCAN